MKSIPVGIMTVNEDYFLMNYGSFLQHYALRLVLTRLGYAPFRVLYRSYLRTLARYALTPFLGKGHDRMRRFIRRERFASEYRKLIGPVFELPKKNPSAYVVGSDCVWMTHEPCAFLIGKEYVGRKIAYAVSTAWDLFEDDSVWRSRLQEVDETFAAVAVREEYGRRTVAPLLPHQKVDCVLDPTMLLTHTDYEAIVSGKPYFAKPTLLYYVVNVWTYAALQLDLLEATAKSLNCELKIIGIQGAEDFTPKRYRLDPNPCDFIRAIRDAAYVVTNSFHGIAFSIVFRKQFVFLTQLAKRYGNQNCRQDEVLTKMNLLNRRIDSATVSPESLKNAIEVPLDVKSLDGCCEAERSRCLKWLKDALS